jgi:aspartate/methionine/tyrosine aminotransferase
MRTEVPPLARRLDGLAGSVYSQLMADFAAYQGESYPLHVGDTWLDAPDGCAPEELTGAEWPGMNRYTVVPGLPALREAVAARVAQRSAVPVVDDEVVIAAGATGGLLVTVGAIVEDGGEVLILCPAWPLVAGMVRLYGGVPVLVPFVGEVDAAEEVARYLDRWCTTRTVAIYVNTPNNPTGWCVPPAVVEAIAAWARARGLWVLADEVYEDFDYTGPHPYARTFAPERTISVWSCSKGFGMAGARVGWVVAPPTIIAAARKLTTYTYYCAPHASQVAALRALDGAGARWVDRTRPVYEAVGRAAAARLGVSAPEGSTFLFVDVGEGRTVEEVLRACVRRGLLLAPGTAFGPYPRRLRLCFTAVEPERTLRGVDVLAGVLGR